jgi:hypothetical protein
MVERFIKKVDEEIPIFLRGESPLPGIFGSQRG